mmetsp:Transcript_7218/g.11422  ORF Transcript_7218/g.11422 Transcript_7218/m.11422 type:complete len:595 (-) Transcript_7218:834-2618(-)
MQWEIVALNNPTFDTPAILKKLADVLDREKRSKGAARRKSETGFGGGSARKSFGSNSVSTPPMMNTRTIKRMAGHSRRVDEFSSSAQAKASATKRAKIGGASGIRFDFTTPTKSGALAVSSPIAATTSPICTTGAYKERKDMGKIEIDHNSALEACKPQEKPVEIEILSKVDDSRYMYSTIEQRAEELENQMCEMRQLFKQKHGWEEDDFSPVGFLSAEPVLVCGRICCEAPNGKLNAKSLLLEGSRIHSNGARVKMEVESTLPVYSLFPGQIVVAKGRCPSGHTLHVTELYSEIPPESPKVDNQEKQSLSMMCAVGPFSTQEDLEYEPLEDLLGVVNETQPDVLLLMGPFVHDKHPQIASCLPTKLIEDTPVALTFQDVFTFLLTRIAASVENLKTRVVLCPSTEDIMHHHISFPQPAFHVNMDQLELKDRQQMTFISNPGIISINGISIGVTTQDTLLHLAQEDVVKLDKNKPKKMRIARLAEHMVTQRSFYPLFPPSQEAMLDFTKRRAFVMPVQPDLLFMSSKLKHFVNDIADKTLCINPGKLTRGKNGGVFAKIYVVPQNVDDKGLQDEEELKKKHSILPRTKVQVIRI